MDTRMQSEREHAQRAMDEAKTAARETASHLKSSASDLVESGKESAQRFGAALENAKNNIQEKAVTSAKATDRAIRDHPYESLGIAFGIGILLGVLINRK